MYAQNLFQAGNSQVVAIPKELFDDMGFQKGQKVFVDKADDNSILIKKSTHPKVSPPASRTEFKKWLTNVLKEDEGILDELADR